MRSDGYALPAQAAFTTAAAGFAEPSVRYRPKWNWPGIRATAESGIAPAMKSFRVHGATERTPAVSAAWNTRARYAACSPSVFERVLTPVSPITIGAGATVAW